MEYHAGRLLKAKTSGTLENLNRYMSTTRVVEILLFVLIVCSLPEEIARFIKDESSYNFLSSLVTTDEWFA